MSDQAGRPCPCQNLVQPALNRILASVAWQDLRVDPLTAQRLKTIVGTFGHLDLWRERMSHVLIAEPGSELEVDDTDWPYPPMSMSQLVWAGLSSAREHLQAVRVHIEHGQLFPLAHLSMIRAAVVGASQGVWLLADDDRDVRLKRSRHLANYAYSEHLKFLTVLQAVADEPHEGTDTVASHTATRLAQIEQLRSSTMRRVSFITSDMITGAAKAAFDDKRLELVAESIWRQTSGAAHGLAWSILGVADTSILAGPDDDTVVAEAGGGFDRIAEEYMCAFKMAEAGWDLLDRRNSSPTGAPTA